jgi:hypothetical protein
MMIPLIVPAPNLRKNPFRFVSGDAIDTLGRIEPHSVDTVFCLGFFYHVANHMLLLSKIARLKPKYLILDTALYLDPHNVIALYEDDPEGEANAARIGADAPDRAVCGAPSKGALELMLSSSDGALPIMTGTERVSIDDCVDYHEGWRVTLRVNCAHHNVTIRTIFARRSIHRLI